MALQYFGATTVGYRYGEYVGDVFFGVIVTGANLTYDVNGVPVGGTISAMRFEESRLNFNGWTTDLERITFPAGTQVTTLTAKGFDWFDSAGIDITQAVFDVTTIISKFDKLGLHASNYETTPFSIIRSGNQDDRIYANDDPYFNGEIYSGAGKDKIFATGFSVYVNAGAENDYVTVSAFAAVVDGGTGKDTITITGTVYANVNAGADDDRVSVTAYGNIVVDGGTGHDQITVSGLGYEGYYAEVYGGKGNDTITGSDAGGEFLYGNAGHDVIHLGGVGSDYLDVGTGGAGNDLITSTGVEGDAYLIGGLGNDTLIGGIGHNFLWGGDGNDVLIGNGGLDTYMLDRGFDVATASADLDAFVFVHADTPTNATIIGFDVNQDWLLIDTEANLSAEDSYDLFIARSTQVGDDVLYDDGAGNTLLLRDVLLGNITAASIVGDDYTGPPPFDDSF